MLKQINKKAISPMIGYILLISFAVIISTFVYIWMGSYVPKNSLECNEGVSVFIKDVSCTQISGKDTYNLSFTIKNNGRFNIMGYFVTGINNSAKEELIDISSNIQGDETWLNPGVLFSGNEENSLEVEEEKYQTFLYIENITTVEITPMRYEIIDERKRTLTCTDATIRQKIACV